MELAPLVTHRFEIAKAESAYMQLLDGSLGSAVGVELDYPVDTAVRRHVKLPEAKAKGSSFGDPRIAVIGAGLYGKAVLLPALEKIKGISRAVLVTSTGAGAAHNAKRFGFLAASTDSAAVFESKDIDGIIVATPHDQHASAVLMAIAANKPLFLEKPLCVTPEELEEISDALAHASVRPIIMVGHNRRYSPHTAKIRSWLETRVSPLVLDMRINAGFVPPEHWVHSERQGRSRIVGEMTHFLDLICALTGARFRKVQASRVSGDDRTVINNDNLSAVFELTDGSIATLIYSAQGTRATPREQTELFSGGQTITSEDFKQSVLVTPGGRKEVFKTSGAQAGYLQELELFANVVRGTASPTPSLDDTVHVMRAAFALEKALAEGNPVTLDPA